MSAADGADDGTFYMGYTRSRPDWIPKIASGKKDVRLTDDGGLVLVDSDHAPIPLLTNAYYRWSDAKERFLDPFTYDTPRIFDSGGYNVQAAYAERVPGDDPPHGRLKDDVSRSDVRAELERTVPFYPWSVEQYHEWLAANADQFEWAPTMDYACEARFDCLWSVQDRMDATIQNTIRQFNLCSGEYDLLPVLQGRSVDQYVESYDRLKAAGVPVERVGLGTVCRISSSNAIAELEAELRARRDFEHIHGFGCKVNSYELGAGFESADSQSWATAPSNIMEERFYGGTLKRADCEDSLRRTVLSFREYYRRAKYARTGTDPLPPLFDADGPVDGARAPAAAERGGCA